MHSASVVQPFVAASALASEAPWFPAPPLLPALPHDPVLSESASVRPENPSNQRCPPAGAP
jgi:hypothetical protein